VAGGILYAAHKTRGKVRGALPRTPPGDAPWTQARFPFCPMFQNGPRRQGFASPRTNRAPLTAAGRSEEFPMRRESGQMQTQNLLSLLPGPASRWSAPSCTTSLE